jgi:aromatic ring-opening dioxygenase catalytic subunit (LigB family)
VKNEVMDNELLNDNDSEMITLLSNEDNECSIKFETMNEIIIDYGTFIRMTIMTNENDKN